MVILFKKSCSDAWWYLGCSLWFWFKPSTAGQKLGHTWWNTYSVHLRCSDTGWYYGRSLWSWVKPLSEGQKQTPLFSFARKTVKWLWKYEFWFHWSNMIPKDKWLTGLERCVGEFEPWQRLERQICVLSKVRWAAFQAAYQVARLPAWRIVLVIGKDWKGSKCQVDQFTAKLFQQDAEFDKWYGPHLFAITENAKSKSW